MPLTEELETIQEELQSTWDKLVRHRHALQDRAKGRPSCHPAWTGMRHTTWACNKIREAMTEISVAQYALREDNR